MVRKIEKIAAQLGYRPNPVASSLRTQRTGMIGLILPNLSDPLFAPIIAAVEEHVAGNGYVTFVASSDYRPEKLLSIIELMSRQYVAGIVVASFDLDDPAADLCLRLGIPTVAVLRDPRHPAISSIAMDDERGVEALVGSVLDLGHRSIAYITAPLAASTAQNRLNGFLAAAGSAAASGCRFDVIEAAAYDVQEGTRVMSRLVAKGLRWTAILCFNDLLAVGSLVALKKAGIDCPDQVSIAGVNDLPFMDLLSPPLTSVQNAGWQLGEQGAMLLMRLIENHEEPPRRILLPAHPVLRGSTGPAPIVAAQTVRPPRRRAASRATTQP